MEWEAAEALFDLLDNQLTMDHRGSFSSQTNILATLVSAIKHSVQVFDSIPSLRAQLEALLENKCGVLKVTKSLISFNPLQPTRFPGRKFVRIFYSPLLKNSVGKILDALKNGSYATCFYGPAGFGKSYGLLVAYLSLRVFSHSNRDNTTRDKGPRFVYINDPSYLTNPGEVLYHHIFFDLINAFCYHGLRSEASIEEFITNSCVPGVPNDAYEVELCLDKKALRLICRSYILCAEHCFDLQYFMTSFEQLMIDLSLMCKAKNAYVILLLDQFNSLFRPMAIPNPTLVNMFLTNAFPKFSAKICVASGNFQDLAAPRQLRLSLTYKFLLELCHPADFKKYCAEVEPNLIIDDAMLSYISRICGHNLLEARLLLTGCVDDAVEDADEEGLECDVALGHMQDDASPGEGNFPMLVDNHDFIRDPGLLDLSKGNHIMLFEKSKRYFQLRSGEIRAQHQQWWRSMTKKYRGSSNDFFLVLPYLDCHPIPASVNIDNVKLVLDGRFMFLMNDGNDPDIFSHEDNLENMKYRLVASSPFIKDEIVKFHIENSNIFPSFSHFFKNMDVGQSFKENMLERIIISFFQKKANEAKSFTVKINNDHLYIAPSIHYFDDATLESQIFGIPFADKDIYTCFVPAAKNFADVDLFLYRPRDCHFIMLQAAVNPEGHSDVHSSFLKRPADRHLGLLKSVVLRCLTNEQSIDDLVTFYYLTADWQGDDWRRRPFQKKENKTKPSTDLPHPPKYRNIWYINSWFLIPPESHIASFPAV